MRIGNIGLNKGIILGFSLIMAVVMPFVAFGGGKTIYVDQTNSGSKDGSKNHPYTTIDSALEHASAGDEIVIAQGTYKENITIPKEVWIYGENGRKNDVTIKAKNDDKPTVQMKHDSKLSDITIEGGRHGVRVLEDSKAHLYNVRIKESNRDGIHIDSAKIGKKKRVTIDKVEIEESDRAGIYSEKRTLTIIHSDIHDNRGDGIDLALGTHAWLEKNTFNKNRGSGAKLVLDDASIWSKNNEFKNNKREGIEVSSFGEQGTIEFKRAKISGNDRYGVARLGRTSNGMTLFGNVSFGIGINASTITRNGLGDVSQVLSVR